MYKSDRHLARSVSVVFAASQKDIHRPTTVKSRAARCQKVPVAASLGLSLWSDLLLASSTLAATRDVAKQTEGMSGRQLAKLVLAFQSAVFGSGTTRLTQGLAQTVLQWRLSHPNA
eukprot:s3944_g7.t1